MASSKMAPGAERAAVLVPSSLAVELREPLGRYQANVRRHSGVQLEIIAGDWGSPPELREGIARLHRTLGITGVVLVGDLPMHRFHMHDFANPNPLYYEDFSLEFADGNGDGIDDHYLGEPSLKVWVANLRLTPEAGPGGAREIAEFLNKTEAYFDGKRKPERSALLVAGADWKGSPGEMAGRHFVPHWGAGSTLTLEPPALGKNELAEALARRRHAVFNFQVHSCESEQDLERDGQAIRAADIAGQFRPGATFIANHGCSSCNWLKSRESRTPNISMTWLKETELTQAVAGNVRVGMIYGIDSLYLALAKGGHLGGAYRQAKQSAENEMRRDFPDGSIISGVVLLGNPFFNPLAGPFAP